MAVRKSVMLVSVYGTLMSLDDQMAVSKCVMLVSVYGTLMPVDDFPSDGNQQKCDARGYAVVQCYVLSEQFKILCFHLIYKGSENVFIKLKSRAV
ncbi:hypothetical protein AVEN_27779-1 [Araneus ventricosus]|uniref:Uncharacterized protein n=1 Tax=Araneus ventricosus TaxID=182803 RepID=A0A4Y2VDU0_ARAVE|nr:hypothetical protein AVEN_27779-1 [Araneus ventricosus]